MNKTFKTIIDEDGFVRLPIRIYGPNRKSIKLIGIVDTASSYVIIPHSHANYSTYLRSTNKNQRYQYSLEAAL